MTIKKLQEAQALSKEISELESKIATLKPSRTRNPHKPKKDDFVAAKFTIKLGYDSAVSNGYGGFEYKQEEKTIEIPAKMAKFLYYQYLNQQEAKLHHLKTQFERL